MQITIDLDIDRPEWDAEKTVTVTATMSGRGDEFSVDDYSAFLDDKPFELTAEESEKAEEMLWDKINDPYANDYNP